MLWAACLGDLRSEWREFDHVLCFKSEHSWHEHCTLLVVVLLLVLSVTGTGDMHLVRYTGSTKSTVRGSLLYIWYTRLEVLAVVAQTVLVLLESVELALVWCTRSSGGTGTGLILAVHWFWHWRRGKRRQVLERQISAWEQVGNKQTWWEHGTTWEPRRSFIQLFFATIKNLGTKEEFFSTLVRAAWNVTT